MGENEAKLASLETDNEWIKATLVEIKDKIEDISDHLKRQDRTMDKFVTREEHEELVRKVDKLTHWRSWLTGAVGTLVGLFILGFEYLHQWIAGGGK
ncbi:hypothetical protein [Alicyclobacillus sendaiensis]|uniref:hypothetical protein n=1 Tax=Alicyclobacillus sendaiensis TaxID=192387 RepID=UPI0026F43371|nr:hypothetical protein [Alicyclobacillus sendaiensis]